MTTTITIKDKAINATYQDKTGTTSGTGTGAKFDITKENGVYTGRKTGTNESVESFLNKPKNKQAIHYLNMGWKAVDIAKEIGIHINTITKIKKIINSK